MREKNKYNWINNLGDNELKKLMNFKYKDYKIKDELNLKIMRMIKNPVELKKEPKSIPIKDMFFDRPFFKYALSFGIFIIIVFSIFYILPMISKMHLNKCFAYNIKGEVYQLDKNTNNQANLIAGKQLNQSSMIVTGIESSADLKIANDSKIYISENTKLELTLLYKDHNKKNTNIFLEEGELKANPEKIKGESSFEIQTEIISVGVRGTTFIMSADKEKNTKVRVIEGRIYARIKFNKDIIASIKSKDKYINDEIKKILAEEIILNENESFEASYNKYQESERKITNILNEIKTMDNINPQAFDSKLKEIKMLRNSIIKIEAVNTSNEINDNLEEKDKKLFQIKKLGNLGIKLIEKNTSITSDGKNIFIASDFNKAIYLINPINGRLKWKFSNPDLIKITSPVSFYKDKIIISSPNMIFILNQNGEVVSKENINKGASFWADSNLSNDKLYIPTSETVYVYDGNLLSKLENLPDSMGQIYIAGNKNNLILSYSNSQEIKIYDLIKNNIIWTSNKLEQRSFMTPFIFNDNIYIIDNTSYAYKLNQTKKDVSSLIINTGAISNIILKNTNLYFVGNNGNFYKLKPDLSSCQKIERLDTKPDMNKYLTKKLLASDDDIYFCCDTGRLFNYNLSGRQSLFIEIPENKDNKPLISSPVKIGSRMFVFDSDSNIYELEKKRN